MANKVHVLDKNFSMWTRDERPGDALVMDEVIRNDTYMLRELAAVLGRVETIMDVGGHIGTFSVLAARWWPRARMFAVEPNPRSYDLLTLNYKDYISNEGKTYNGAIRYDEADLLTDGASATGGGFMAAPNWKPDPVVPPGHERYDIMTTSVQLFRIGQILDENGVGRVDLLKLDCEGSEMEILRDMPDEEAARIGAICGEYHYGAKAILDLLQERFPGNVSRAGSDCGHKEIGRFWSLPKDKARHFPFPF